MFVKRILFQHDTHFTNLRLCPMVGANCCEFVQNHTNGTKMCEVKEVVINEKISIKQQQQQNRPKS